LDGKGRYNCGLYEAAREKHRGKKNFGQRSGEKKSKKIFVGKRPGSGEQIDRGGGKRVKNFPEQGHCREERQEKGKRETQKTGLFKKDQ